MRCRLLMFVATINKFFENFLRCPGNGPLLLWGFRRNSRTAGSALFFCQTQFPEFAKERVRLPKCHLGQITPIGALQFRADFDEAHGSRKNVFCHTPAFAFCVVKHPGHEFCAKRSCFLKQGQILLLAGLGRSKEGVFFETHEIHDRKDKVFLHREIRASLAEKRLHVVAELRCVFHGMRLNKKDKCCEDNHEDAGDDVDRLHV